MTIRRWMVSVLGLSALLGHGATSVSAMTLEEVASLAVKKNPEILAASENRESVAHQVRQAWAGYLPNLNASLGRGKEWSDNSTTRGTGDHELKQTHTEASLTLNQMLFDGFNVKSNVEKAQAQLSSASFGLERTTETVLLNVVDTYLEVLKREELLELVKDNVRLHQEILGKVKAKAAGGAGNDADVQQTETRLALASANHASSHGAWRNAFTRFERLVGQAPDKLQKANVPFKLLPETLEKAVDQAKLHHPQILAAQADMEAAESDVGAARSGLFPQLSLEVSVSNNDNIGGVPSYNKNALALLRLNQNLYRGGADEARIRASQRRIDQSRETLELARATIVEGVKAAWDNLQVSKDRIQYLNKHADISRKVVQAYHDQFKMGKRTLLDVLNSENELFAAKSALASEKLTHEQNAYRLLSAMGSLTSTMGFEEKPMAANEEPSWATRIFKSDEKSASTPTPPAAKP
ncbi:MAG: TolC family outer membrane protein [Magnetococcales bacterium]|nr:TolC family outer membrane protein [Magnetococcales bacterium]